MIQLINCGYNFVHDDGIVINRPSGSGNYAFVFFKCQSEVIVKGRSFVLDKNTYILFHPDTCHLYREVDKPFVNDWFHCEDRNIGDFLAEIQFPLDTPIKAEDPHLISRSIMDLQNLGRHNSPFQQRILDHDLKSFFLKLVSLREKSAILEKTNRYFSQFSKLRSQLYNSPGHSFSVDSLAASLNLSKSYFQHLYKQLFGCSVVSDIIHARLEYAKYLLATTSLTVCEISKLCGYENDTHFMRQFKKFIGTTPGKYKGMQFAEHPWYELQLPFAHSHLKEGNDAYHR
ncbi:AraC family transcriptional regulator of arabinose operon [Paenibacillus phyllosphaerae]|uniref:AraC family transcriptional regulator of arabinose operon n=1 Tax=Paenibacillus phyllosphaerae TaxID=274593 RepID=A0A7W5FRC1_9BACL|nr:AraC family transcriptional regulator [Paenibacillus phyllosphaerae]MBB3114193.1 AraC family transcriptional regulator of arabinose operon [Paenibacillus phyllosphaerae]